MTTQSRPVALVTGASSGIGADLARELAADGHDLILVARTEAALTALAAELESTHGAKSTILAADLSRPGAASDLLRRVDAAGLAVDVLINNAGFGSRGDLSRQDLVVIDGMIAVNVTAATEMARLFAPTMIRRRRGRIMNVASTASFQPGPSMAVYCATKAYMRSFSLALGEELKGTGVTVTALCPGPTVTKFGEVAGVANSAAFAPSLVMGSAEVAKGGYKAMKDGARIFIPGASNRMGAMLSRFIPNSIMLPMVRRMMAPVAAKA